MSNRTIGIVNVALGFINLSLYVGVEDAPTAFVYVSVTSLLLGFYCLFNDKRNS